MEEWVTDESEKLKHEITIANSRKQSLLSEAEQMIVMLERKIRLGMATAEDQVKLTKWEIFSIEVTDTDTSAGIATTWPVFPDSVD